MNTNIFFSTSRSRVAWRITVRWWWTRGMGRSAWVFSLTLFPKLVWLILFLMDLYDFNVALTDIHAVLAVNHLFKLSWYFNNRLPRKLPMLKNQTQSIRFDIESIGLNKSLHNLVLGYLERESNTSEVTELLSWLDLA